MSDQSAFSRIQIAEALVYLFRERGWGRKLTVLAVLLFVPILNFAVVGYELEVARRVAGRQQPILPEWEPVGDHFRRGTALALARYVYVLPAFLLAALAFASGASAFAVMGSSYESWGGPLLLVCGVSLVALFLVAWFAGAITPAVTVRHLRTPTFAACFNIPGIFRQIRRSPGAHLAVFLGTMAASVGLSLVVGPAASLAWFVPCLGMWIVPAVYAAMFGVLVLVTAHLDGQLLRAVVEAEASA